MSEEQNAELYELADLVHAVARQLPAPSNLEPGPCTPIEINVMRFVGNNPGVSARAAADACGLPTSNFSRVLRGLVAKGLVERRSDPRDARVVHLHPTDRALKNTLRMREAWAAKLRGAALDHETVTTVSQALRRIVAHLAGAATRGEDPTGDQASQDDEWKRRTTDAG